MQGMMMDRQLRIIDLLLYAADQYPTEGITSVMVEDGSLHHESYPQMLGRVARLAQALTRLGVAQGDRVATLAWNGFRHMELYYAIPAIGAVCHTLNPRLSAEQASYIVNHAADKVLFLDLTFVPLAEALAPHFPADLIYVVMTDRAHMPETKLNALCYEELLEAEDGQIDWPEFDERSAAGLCYTSGTTGNPKGALQPAQPGAARPSGRTVAAELAGAGQAHPARGAAVSRQFLGSCPCRATDRHDAGDAGAQARRGLDLGSD